MGLIVLFRLSICLGRTVSFSSFRWGFSDISIICIFWQDMFHPGNTETRHYEKIWVFSGLKMACQNIKMSLPCYTDWLDILFCCFIDSINGSLHALFLLNHPPARVLRHPIQSLNIFNCNQRPYSYCCWLRCLSICLKNTYCWQNKIVTFIKKNQNLWKLLRYKIV